MVYQELRLSLFCNSCCDHTPYLLHPAVHCLYRFPGEGGITFHLNTKEEKERWKNMKQNVVNSMCREARSKKRRLV